MGLQDSSGEKASPRNLGQGAGRQPDTWQEDLQLVEVPLGAAMPGSWPPGGKVVRASQALICQVHQVRPRAFAHFLCSTPPPQQRLGSLLFWFSVALQSA